MEMFPKKEVYSLHDVGKICRVEPGQMQAWFQDSKLPFFEIPGGHKRIKHADFENFLKNSGLSLPEHWNGTFDKFKVLVVEDDPDLLEIIVELLNEEPRVEVHAEDRGFSAGLHVASWHPDLILLDFLMPGMSGFEVCKNIRANPSTTDIPVLAMTSLATRENRQAVMDSGVSDFLGKPFASQAFFEKIHVMLGLAQQKKNPINLYTKPQL